MATDHDREARDRHVLDSLTEAQRQELERRRFLRVGDSLIWFEPETGVRSDRIQNLYYIRTDRGVFRVSRISDEVVEV
jgi:hypothetical protein